MMDRARSSAPRLPAERCAQGGGFSLFLRRWARNPLQMGSVVPSSPALCRRIARLARWGPGESVVELGAGTGVVSRALLRSGLPPEPAWCMDRPVGAGRPSGVGGRPLS
jgi:phosphatidylethanolamine/phosphatidyl-N-methylethanolamine N-methyltransferase